MLRVVLGCLLVVVPLCLLICISGIAVGHMVNRQQIAYSGSIGAIHLEDVALNLQVEVVNGLSDIPTSFNWSPDGQYMLFALLNMGVYDLYLVEISTGQIEEVLLPLSSGTLPVWSPDSATVAYLSERSDICLYDIFTEDLRCLPHKDVEAVVWSPAGNEIAFIAGNALYLTSLTDGSARQIAALSSLARSLAWSPDGKSIVYTAEDFATDVRDLFMVEVQTGEVRNITNNINGYAFSAVWSPDSTQLAYISQQGLNFDVHIYDLDRQTARNISDNPAYEGIADWASDGQYLAYISDRNGLPAVYIQREGALPRFINIAVSYNAAWRPTG